jgi:hypothetical protein
MAQDGPGQWAIAVPTSGCGPLGGPHFAHPGRPAKESRPACAPAWSEAAPSPKIFTRHASARNTDDQLDCPGTGKVIR